MSTEAAGSSDSLLLTKDNANDGRNKVRAAGKEEKANQPAANDSSLDKMKEADASSSLANEENKSSGDSSEASEFTDLPSLEDVNEVNQLREENNGQTSAEAPSPPKSRGFSLGKPKPEVIDDDGWLDVLENGQLKKRVIKEGETSQERPQRTCKVTIAIKTKIQETGQVVASETSDSMVGFVGDYDFMHGVDLAIPLMYPNEVARVVIAARFAFGEQGKEPDVPANATLETEIHLIGVEWLESESSLSLDDRIKFGERKKERGNFWYNRNDASTAIHCYRRSVEFLDGTDEEMDMYHAENPDGLSDEHITEIGAFRTKMKQLLKLRTMSLNNLAAAQMKTEAYDAALKSVNSVLQVDQENVKALYRKGKILAGKGEIADAIVALAQASKLEPSNRAIQADLVSLGTKRRQEIDKEKRMYQRMLQTDPVTEAKTRENVQEKEKMKKWGLIVGGVSAAVAAAAALVYQFYAA